MSGETHEGVHEGGCLCGKVRYRITAPLADILVCHCRQCRRMSGHLFAATAAPREGFELTEDAGLAWYQSSEKSRRGFCRVCGSSLFFDHGPDEPMGVSAGSLDEDPQVPIAAQIYVDEAGGYYSLDPGINRYDKETWSRGGWKLYRRS